MAGRAKYKTQGQLRRDKLKLFTSLGAYFLGFHIALYFLLGVLTFPSTEHYVIVLLFMLLNLVISYLLVRLLVYKPVVIYVENLARS